MLALVTGCAGFIASNLVGKLIFEGFDVIGVDNFYSGKQSNLEKLSKYNNFTFLNIDISNTEFFIKKLKDFKIDIVYHFASNTSIPKSNNKPFIDFTNTFSTTFSVLELVRINKIKYFVFSSSSTVYAESKNFKLSENTTFLAPISYYGGAKLASEAFIVSYTNMNNLHTKIFRFSNVVGPNMTNGVVLDFIKKLEMNHKELLIYGDGTQTKPYIYVDDVVSAIIKFTKKISLGVDVVNVGNKTQISVNEIAKIVCNELGYRDVVFKYTGGKRGWKGDVSNYSLDLSKIYSMGWKTKLSSNEAIKQTVEIYKAEHYKYHVENK